MTTNCIHGIHIEDRCRECEAMDSAVAADEQARRTSPTPQQQYIQWLDSAIEKASQRNSWDDSAESVVRELEEAKEQFITLFQINTDDKAGDTR